MCRVDKHCPQGSMNRHIIFIRRGTLFSWMWKVECEACGKRWKDKEWNNWG